MPGNAERGPRELVEPCRDPVNHRTVPEQACSQANHITSSFPPIQPSSPAITIDSHQVSDRLGGWFLGGIFTWCGCIASLSEEGSNEYSSSIPRAGAYRATSETARPVCFTSLPTPLTVFAQAANDSRVMTARAVNICFVMAFSLEIAGACRDPTGYFHSAEKNVSNTLPLSPMRQTKRSASPVFSPLFTYASPKTTTFTATSSTFEGVARSPRDQAEPAADEVQGS